MQSQQFARRGHCARRITRVVAYIKRAVADGSDREVCWHILMAALLGGMAIYIGLGPVHALGYPRNDAGALASYAGQGLFQCHPTWIRAAAAP